jgi:acyl-CoA thioesterase-1
MADASPATPYSHARRYFKAACKAAVEAAAAVLVFLLAATPGVVAAEFTLLVLGDSLVAGYGLERRDAFPTKLEAALGRDGLAIRVVNAGVSGDTSAGGRARLAWAFADRPDAMIVELGANDGLRGLAPAQTFANLDAILAEAGREGIAVLLAGMRAPPNLGREYAAEFDAIYPRLAARHGVDLYPFFLAGVAARRALNQADGIHPNAAGVDEIVRRMLPAVRALIANAHP